MLNQLLNNAIGVYSVPINTEEPLFQISILSKNQLEYLSKYLEEKLVTDVLLANKHLDQYSIRRCRAMVADCQDLPVETIDFIGRCVANCNQISKIRDTISACLTISIEDREDFATFMASSIVDNYFGDGSEISDCILMYKTLETEAWRDWDMFITPLMAQFQKVHDRKSFSPISVFLAYRNLSLSERKSFITFADPLLTKLKESARHSEIYQIVCELDISKHKEFTDLFNALLLTYAPKVVKILQLCAKIPSDEKLLLMQLLPALDSDNLMGLTLTLDILAIFPPRALSSLQLHLTDIIAVAGRQRLKLLNTLAFMPPEDWSDFIADTTSQLPQDIEARNRRTGNYLYGLLETTKQEHRAKAYADYIITNRNQLGFTDALFGPLDTAKSILQVSPDSLRNPYTIYAKLEQFWDTPLLEFQPPSQSIAGMDVTLNLASFREKWIAPVKTDIDLRIHPDLFGRLLTALKNRIQNLPSYTKKKAAKDAIKTITDVELQYLVHQFPTLHLIQLLDRIYALPTGAALSQPEWQLIQLLTYLLNTETILENNAPLTEQETLLLHIARAIANCDAGQNRAIAALVRGIEKNAFRDIQLSATEDEAAALQLIHAVVQKQKERANDLFDAENGLMLRLAGPNGVKQLVHQAPYVRNMLAPILGLDHTLYFDLHAEAISQELLKMSREDLLDIFFQYPDFTPGAFVTALQHNLSRPITEKDYGWTRGAIELLTKFGHSTADCFDIEADKFILTEKGAILLLQAAGYAITNKS